ncbi:MAG: hypothetical protein KC492_14010, partial [Myxococcales bacterium]|nr:hypothetical protein [Myxococcales bacterium]
MILGVRETSASEVRIELAEYVSVLDGGTCPVGTLPPARFRSRVLLPAVAEHSRVVLVLDGPLTLSYDYLKTLFEGLPQLDQRVRQVLRVESSSRPMRATLARRLMNLSCGTLPKV